MVQAIQEGLCGNLRHFLPWLANCRETRVLKGRAIDVIESDDRNIFRHAKTGVSQRTYSADGGKIVVSKKRGKVSFLLQEPLHHRIADFRGKPRHRQLKGQ